MANVKISALPTASTPLSGTELVPIVKGGITSQTTVGGLLGGPNGSALAGFLQSGSGAVATTVQDKLRQTVSIKDFGADATGVTNSYTAFLNASNSGALSVFVNSGTYLINSNITISPSLVFEYGAVLKPANGVTITLSNWFQAPIGQIFDLSLGGTVALPRSCGDVYAEWWGAVGDGYLGVGTGAKLNNDVPIQQAIDAVYATVQGVEGGRVHIDRGTFYVSAQINIPNQVSIIGNGSSYPAIFANPTGWTASSSMFYASNGSSSMFNSRIENLRIKANNVANITFVVRSVAWQEKCGLRNVLITDFSNYGFFYSQGYGGAASLLLKDCEIWAGAGASSCIYADLTGYTVGFFQLNVDNCTLSGASSQQAGLMGIKAKGRVIVNVNNVHVEYMQTGILVENACCITGQSFTTSGNNDVLQVINCASGWTGTIDASNVKLCGASNYIVDSNRPYPIANVQPSDDRLVWPPNANRVFASATVFTAGSSPALTYSQNIASISHPATGTYRLDFTTSAYATQYYDLICTSQDSTVIEIAAQNQNASYFYVYTKNTSGVLTDSSAGFSVRAYHRP